MFRRLTSARASPVCGQISQYNLERPELAPRDLDDLIVFRARIEGFLINDYAIRFPEACGASALARRGPARLPGGRDRRARERAPSVHRDAHGENRGKALVRIS